MSRRRGFGLIRWDIGPPFCSRWCCVSWVCREGPHFFCGWLAPRRSSLVALRWWPSPSTVSLRARCSRWGPPSSHDLYPEPTVLFPSTAIRRRIRTYILQSRPTCVVSALWITETCINFNWLKYYYCVSLMGRLLMPPGRIFSENKDSRSLRSRNRRNVSTVSIREGTCILLNSLHAQISLHT